MTDIVQWLWEVTKCRSEISIPFKDYDNIYQCIRSRKSFSEL